jgi:Secretion system C-terminal sorting domain
MKIRNLLIAVLLNLVSTITFAQITDTIQVEKDALIREFNGVGDNTNYGNYPYINMHAWTNGGVDVIHRTLVDFDLSTIPNGSTILNAELLLYTDKNSTKYPTGHDVTSGSNACIIRRIISSWTENSVTWNNQPGTSVVNQVMMPQSTSNFQDYSIEVTKLVQDMINDTSNSFGFRINLQDEIPYRRLVFASQDNGDTAIHPKLVITYDVSSGLEESNFTSLNFSLYPNPTRDFATLTFENSNNDNYTLTLIDGLGRILRTIPDITTGRIIIETNDLIRGLYFFQLKSGGQIRGSGKLTIE